LSANGLTRDLALRTALTAFATTAETQGQQHIRPFHRYMALRLVVEGGFLPEEVTPHPPLQSSRRGRSVVLRWAPDAETTSERTIIGGLKSKDVDVVVCKEYIGPVVAVSLKGTGGAFRNLTNRMEEAIGDCTNVHLMYPGLVYGFFSLIRGNREGGPGVNSNDVCIKADGSIVDAVRRYHDILEGLSGREHVRDDPSRYEAVAMTLVECHGDSAGLRVAGLPPAGGALDPASFFPSLYRLYDLRYPYMARIAGVERVAWSRTSPVVQDILDACSEDPEPILGYGLRLA